MNTFERLQTLFLRDLYELHQMRKRGMFVLPMTRTVREEHLGRCCFFAEEFLTPDELREFKQRLGLGDQQWRSYKEKICEQ